MVSAADVGDADEGYGAAYVTAFSRGLAVLRSFEGSRRALTISDVARASSLSRATARRLLNTLEADGYVIASDGAYRPTPKTLGLGYVVTAPTPAEEIFREQLEDLAAHIHEVCSAGILEDRDVVFVARAESTAPRLMTLAVHVGSRLPAELSAIGRVLLAELDDDQLDDWLGKVTLRSATPHTIKDVQALRKEIREIRTTGFCVVDQEVEVGVSAAAVPVRRRHMPTVGISVAQHATRGTASTLRESTVPLMQDAARRIEHILGLRN